MTTGSYSRLFSTSTQWNAVVIEQENLCTLLFLFGKKKKKSNNVKKKNIKENRMQSENK